MPVYLLDNKIPIAFNDSSFEIGHYEHPGWNGQMSEDNRGIAYSTRVCIPGATINLRSGRWSYKDTWIKKLVEVC